MKRKKLRELTLEEKLTLMTGYDGLAALRLPSAGLEGVQMADGPYGVKTKTGSTCYPNTCLMACSWDREVCRAIGESLGQDCVDAGVELLLSPAINIKRAPLAGRNFEYYAEDPVLTGELASAYVAGLKLQGIAVCAKHYACNNQENGRWSYSSCVDDDTLRNLYLKAFEIVLSKGNVDSVMASYNQINGVYGCQNAYLLQTILRGEWGYEGVVMSDWCAIAEVVPSFQNGLDLEMPANPPITLPIMREAVENGSLSEALVDEKVERLLALYDYAKVPKRKDPSKQLGEEALRKLTGECFVLLKNEGILPLQKEEKVLLVGTGAANAKIQGGGCAKLKTNVQLSPYEEMRAYSSAITLVDGFDCSHVRAEEYDKIVFVLTLPESSDSEAGDREEFSFPAEQVEALLALSAKNANIVAVLQNGSVVDMSFAPYVKGILETYYAGSYAGGALADVLYGKVNPSGKLAETVPMCYDDVPAKCEATDGNIYYREREFVGYRYYASYGVTPRYPFGFGLSYSNIVIAEAEIKEGGRYAFTVRCTLENRSAMAGKQTVQVYLKALDKFSPKMQLLQFETVRVEGNSRATCTVELTEKDFVRYVGGRKGLIEGKYCLCVATSVEDVCLEKEFLFQIEKKEKPFTIQTALGCLLTNEKYRAITLSYMRGAILDWAFGPNPENKDLEHVEGDSFLKNSVYNMPIRSFTYCHRGAFTLEREAELLEKLNEI